MEETTDIKHEPLWHVQIAVLIAIVLQLVLSEKLTIGPKYLIAGLEFLLLIGTTLLTSGDGKPHPNRRVIVLLLIGLISFTNIASLVLVARFLLQGTHHISGQRLILSAIAIFLTNIILFGLWYWQLDGGGPSARRNKDKAAEFLFPQQTVPAHSLLQPNWQPSFFDYFYISVTNATAFSPTDALPLSHRAKLLMTVQGLASLTTVALVAARAVNILA